ncbi:L-lactate permease [Larkinella soli]|uniref:L-lactate permease n=1 Tax=Larkinella soli TaxID=1770527 RepID=UPI000FFCB7A7|nr:lactate permease LctP family transporter [Larkinella soli]
MNWKQQIDPLGNLALSALVAFLPIAFIFWALIIRKMKGYLASLLTILLAMVLAVAVYGMPIPLVLSSTLHGALYGLFPICWIILGAVFLYNITVAGGQFEIIKHFMASITPDRRLQAIIIAFSFGAFLEGSAGMGAPVAITAAMLVGLGFNPLYAAAVCLIANTAPVAFGSVGIPIIIASHVSDLPEMAISQMIGRTLPLLSIVVPFYLVTIMAGVRRSLDVMPAILVAGITFAVFQFLTANYLGPMLPDVIAGLASLAAMMILLRYWKPKSVWRFKEEPPQTTEVGAVYTPGQILRAWSPFLIMTLMIVAWGLQPVKDALNSVGTTKFMIPGLANAILKADGSPLLIKPFDFNYLSNSGLAVMLAALISIPLMGMRFRDGWRTFLDTLYQLRFPALTIASVVGFAFVVNNSGMSVTMAMTLAGTGALFPFFSPVLGWLGVFLTGSDSSANALFGKLQATSAEAIGIDPLLTVSANASGGVTGKMISPQSIAIGTASVGLTGREAELFRFTVKHSFIMLVIISIITTLQAYVFPWIIPEYTPLGTAVTTTVSEAARGFTYLLVLALAVALIVATVLVMNRSKVRTAQPVNP